MSTNHTYHLRSHQLGLEYPYDWSNGGMADSHLIHLVVCRGRFNDLLRIAQYFGLQQIIDVAEKIPSEERPPRLDDIIANIKAGMSHA